MATRNDTKKRLLVVDDHEDNVEVLKARLEARGYEVKGAQDGEAALETIEKWVPDLVLLDVMMPKVDGLTEIDNRRSLESKLHKMFEHSYRLHEPISCVMCDIDHFKKVNDTYGHQVGDEVLKGFAKILKNEAREIDSVGRYGGEEFLLLLPGTVLDAAITFAERLRQRVEEHTFSYEGGTLKR